MKVMLVQCPFKENQTIGPPLGLAYLASSLEKAGHNVKIVESMILNYGLNDIKKEIKLFNPDVVGVSSVTQTIYKAIQILKIAKNCNPNCLTVLGGPHPTVNDKGTIEMSSFIDVIVRGEGEITFPELLKKNRKEDFVNIKGITFRLNGKIVKNPDRPRIKNLDELPFPSHHLLHMNKYKISESLYQIGVIGRQGQQYGTISTSRGCPYGCKFCASNALWGNKWHSRSAENILEELKILRYRYNKKVIDFVEDTFTLDKKRVLKLCDLIVKENLDCSFIATTRVNLFTEDIAVALKKAGFKVVIFGFESGNEKTLNYLCKGFSIEDSKKAVKIAKQVGLDVYGSFIIGVPGETRKNIKKTIAFAKKLDLNYSLFSLFVPFPGTKIYEKVKENKLLLSYDWSKYTITNSIIKNRNFTVRKLKKYQIRAIIYANFKPQLFCRLLKNIIPKIK
jgi:radical SAM superfamily enzyme YgiQ (UPF0313 family)